MTTNPIEHDNIDRDFDQIEFVHETDFADGMNGELEVMLADAYQVPKLPRSLLKRIDHAVEQEWGESPNLAGRREPVTLASVVENGLKMLRTWPVAASLVAVVVLVALLQTNKPAYGWQAMIEALRQESVVQAGESSSESSSGFRVRWLSISDGVLGERSDGLWRLLDFKRGVELRRERDASQITRKPFKRSANNSPDAMFIAFLGNEQTDLQLTGENWSRTGDDVTLHVTLDSDDADPVSLDIVLDSETHLPKSWQAKGEDTDSVVLSYPSTNSTELIAKNFPVDLPVVDENGAVVQSDSLLALAGDQNKAEATANNTSAGAEKKDGAGGAVEKPPLEGVASLGWKPVKRSKLSNDEVVAQINKTLEALWKKHDIEPTKAASDDELLRRVYLDLAGRTPGVSEVRKYFDDKSTDRYVKLVDQLLDSRDHETHLATVWRTHLIPEGIDLSRFGGIQSFEKWMGKQFADNVPYDEVVRRLLLAEGRLSKSGPLLFYAAAKLDADRVAS